MEDFFYSPKGVFSKKKTAFFTAGMLAVLLTFGVVLLGCDNGTTDQGSKTSIL
jgi:hypothetical protein